MDCASGTAFVGQTPQPEPGVTCPKQLLRVCVWATEKAGQGLRNPLPTSHSVVDLTAGLTLCSWPRVHPAPDVHSSLWASQGTLRPSSPPKPTSDLTGTLYFLLPARLSSLGFLPSSHCVCVFLSLPLPLLLLETDFRCSQFPPALSSLVYLLLWFTPSCLHQQSIF